MEKYIPHLIAALWLVGLYFFVFGVSAMFRPSAKVKGPKASPEPRSNPWIRFSSRYQTLMALTVLFFVGVLILYPAAVVFRRWVEKGYGLPAFFELALFLGTLACALAYVWKKGDLSWTHTKESSRD